MLVHEQERQQNRGYSDESSRKKCSENEFERIFRNALDEVKDTKIESIYKEGLLFYRNCKMTVPLGVHE